MKKKIPYLTSLIKKLAPKVGAKFVVESEWAYAGQLIYKNGIVRSLKFYSLDLNPVASADIARDKDFAKFFLNKNKFKTVKSFTIFENSWAQIIGSDRTIKNAHIYANKIGYPIIVKPNSKSQGTDVFKVENIDELNFALKKIFKGDKVALIEKYKSGRDYRVVVLDGEIISVYQRLPLSIIGDGKSSIKKLLEDKQKVFDKLGRDTRINFKDIRIKQNLKKLKLNFASVLAKGDKIYLLDNANLSSGGDSVDVTENIHSDYKKLAIDITKKMGLRICGVDLMLTKGDITKSKKETDYFVIEINAAPGLDHYVTTGKKQQKIVEAMYLKILKALGKKD